jgi:hypothetical protein
MNSLQTLLPTTNKINIVDAALSRISDKKNPATVLIPQICCNTGYSESGFAKIIANKFPIIKQNFEMLGKKNVLGKTQNIIVSHDKVCDTTLIISNMVAQSGSKSNKNHRPINYGALCLCMYDIKNFITENKKSQTSKIEIHSPKFGTGSSGGNWAFIEELIHDIWTGIDVFIYTL